MPPDAKLFPFAELLADLRRRGFGIGLHEYRDVTKLVSRWKGVDRTSFRDALAALLARNAVEVEGIREAFDEWAAAEPLPLPPPPRRVRSWTWHIAAVVLIVVAAAAYFAWRYERDQPPVTNVTPPPATQTVSSRPPPPQLPNPPREPGRQMSWFVTGAIAIAVLLALAVREARRRQMHWTRQYWRHVLANEPGPHHYASKAHPSAPPFPRAAIEEVGTILGRAIDADATNSDVLDVEESLRLTLRAGMAPQLKFQPPPLNVPVLVLRDTAWQMRPWEAKVDYFIRELRRQGVVLEQWFFAGDPRAVSRVPDGPAVGLDTLAFSRSEASLMILSSGQAVSAESLRELERLLKKWNYRTWIHPAGNPEYWRPALNVLPLRIWPMTRAGVHAAAVEISRRGDMAVPPKIAPVRSVTRGDVERMKQLLALAPPVSLEVAQEMRRRFCPEVPEEVMLFLGAEGVFYGDTIAFPPDQLQQLMAAASRDPERERNVRRYLLEMMHESRPPEESAAYLRWQLDESIQRLKLDPSDSGARDTIRDLAQGPLKDEVQSAVTLHGVDVPVRVGVPTQLPSPPPPSLGKRPPVWAWPRFAAAAVAIAVVVPLTMLAARSMKAGAGAPVPHLRGAYTLRWDANAARLFGGITSPAAPPAAALYRDGRELLDSTDLRQIHEFFVSPENTGAWFELRAKLPKGNLATSHPVWVPPASLPQRLGDGSTGEVLLTFVSPDGAPLSDIRYILRGSGDLTATGAGGTPVSVAPGLYRVIVLNSTVTNRLNVGTVTVSPGASESQVFVLRTRSEWYRDAVSRRVVALIMAQLNLTEEAVEPNSDLRSDLGADDSASAALIRAVEEEFGIAISARDAAGLRTPQQLVDFVRTAISRRGERVEALLTFVSPTGVLYDDIRYQLVGVREDFIGIGGFEEPVSPGRYSVVARVYGLEWELGTVTIPAGRPFQQRIRVPLDKRFTMTRERYVEVSPATASEMLRSSPQLVVFDIRPESEFRGPGGYVRGAINTPFNTIERQLPELLPYQNQTVLVYGNYDTDGQVAARLLTIAGFRYVVHMSGGLRDWKRKGYRTIVTQ